MKNSYAHNRKSSFSGLLLAVLMGALSLVGISSRADGTTPPNVRPAGSKLAAAWWEWVFSLPTTASPQFGTADCSAGQSGPVWFLAGTFFGGTITNNCTIPAGTALVFPVANAWADNTGCAPACPPTSNTAAQLLAIAKSIQDNATQLTCIIDGVPVTGLANAAPYRVSSVFNYTLPDDPNNVINYFVLNFCGAAAPGCYASGGTVFPAASDGVFVYVAPLSTGKHTIHFSFVGSPSLDITYNLTVQ